MRRLKRSGGNKHILTFLVMSFDAELIHWEIERIRSGSFGSHLNGIPSFYKANQINFGKTQHPHILIKAWGNTRSKEEGLK